VLTFLLRRIIGAVCVLWAVATLVFIAIQLSPGDPAQVYAGPDATAQDLQAIRQQMGLNHPVFIQYLEWLGHAVRGNLGRSLFTGQSVSGLLLNRAPATLEIVIVALAISSLGGLVLGVLAAWRRGSLTDSAIQILSLFALSIPGFWVALLLLLLFGIYVQGVFPTSGWVSFFSSPGSNILHLILPVFALALPNVAVIARTLRTSMADSLGSDYVTFARARSMPSGSLLYRVALPNALIPATTVVGLTGIYLLGSTVIVENIFTIPGVGQLMITSYVQHDYPTAIGCTLFIALLAVLVNLAVDVLYAVLNPRVRQIYQARPKLREM
jgi:peptide/nickel transport system permease protein